MEEFNKNTKHGYGIFKIIIAVIVTAILTYFITTNLVLKAYLNTSGITYLSTKMALIKQKLDDTYIYDMSEEEMLEYAIKGYVAGINDKYTEYLSKDEMKELMESTTGNYVGVGVYLGNNTESNSIVIVEVIEGSVAEEAGLQAGDIIKTVDDIEYKGEDLEKVSEIFKGKEEGTEVKVTVDRKGEELQFVVKRSNIRVKAVSSSMLENNIGYIKISTFNEGTTNEFKEAYDELKSKEVSGLIIDLRNNGGGLVSESLNIAKTMVNKGNTLLITKNKKDKEKIEKNDSTPFIDIPVVILINENTASASEILAGSLRDNCGYKIVGKTSYGKGVIQTIYSFVDESGIKITTEEYFTPNHNQINKVGITPDIEVELNDEWKNISNIPYENDLQLQKAVEQLK